MRSTFYLNRQVEHVCDSYQEAVEINAEFIGRKWIALVDVDLPLRRNMLRSVKELEYISRQESCINAADTARNALIEIHLACPEYLPWFMNN